MASGYNFRAEPLFCSSGILPDLTGTSGISLTVSSELDEEKIMRGGSKSDKQNFQSHESVFVERRRTGRIDDVKSQLIHLIRGSGSAPEDIMPVTDRELLASRLNFAQQLASLRQSSPHHDRYEYEFIHAALELIECECRHRDLIS